MEVKVKERQKKIKRRKIKTEIDTRKEGWYEREKNSERKNNGRKEIKMERGEKKKIRLLNLPLAG